MLGSNMELQYHSP
jgi:hypothetical protein